MKITAGRELKGEESLQVRRGLQLALSDRLVSEGFAVETAGDGVTAAIPGARDPGQARANAAAADLAPLPEATMARVRERYDAMIRPLVHQRW